MPARDKAGIEKTTAQTKPYHFQKGNKKAVGHGPWKKSRRWATIYHELFTMLKENPEALEKELGYSVPQELKRKDVQLLIAARELERVLSKRGDLVTAEAIRRWMDGSPTQRVDVNVQSKSFVEVVKARHHGKTNPVGGMPDEPEDNS